MDRRAFVAGSLALLTAPLVAGAQQAGKVYRIGFLFPGFPSPSSGAWQAFTQGLRELGWAEGKNIAFEF